MPNCIYCNLSFTTQRSASLHARYCLCNPNRQTKQAWNKGLTSSNDARVRKCYETKKANVESGKTILKGKPHSEETKRKLSEIRKKYLAEHPEAHNWKDSSKFISKPCEYVKNFLRSQNINFIEEYKALDDYNYSIDIAFPDVKIGIEINGDQHYNRDGSLAEYYQVRHDRLTAAGWKIFEILHTKCYSLKTFNEILSLDIYDKDYVGQYFSIKEQHQQKKQRQKEKQTQRKLEKQKLINTKINLIINSGIDFSKYGWVGQVADLLEMQPQKVHKWMSKNMPDFLENCFIRKKSITVR